MRLAAAAGFADLGMCYRLASGGIVLNFYGGSFIQHGFSAVACLTRQRQRCCYRRAVFLVGLCVRNSSDKAISNNNFVNGYAQVTS